jgi:nitrogen fixation protein FixH
MSQDDTPLIPPHIFWPGFVIALLMISITSGVITIVAAQSNGGPQIISSYSTETASDRADLRRQHARNRRLGWSVDVHATSPVAEGTQAPVTIEVRDDRGAPLSNVTGTVELRRPSIAGAIAKARLRPIEGEPGVYRVQFPLDRPGLWDFSLRLERGDDVFTADLRKEL